MKVNAGIILIISGAVLVASALSLASYNVYTDYDAEKKSTEVVQIIEEKIVDKIPEDNYVALDKSNNYYVDNSEMDTIVIEEEEYIGILEIPVLDLKLPVMREWSYPNLKISPCCYTGNIKEDNLVIAAHNYSSHFGNIKHLLPDDTIYFVDVNGIVHEFFVLSSEKLNGSDTEKMEEGEWDLTLFTCNFDGTKRVTVRCAKKDGIKYYYNKE